MNAYSILLVEDERWVRTAIKHTVARTGLPVAVVHECGNGLEALDWLKTGPVDLILADIKMPVMDGLTFVNLLREADHPVSVMMISGHDDFPIVRQSLRAGVFDYLLKPVEVEEMKESLQKWMKFKESSPASGAVPIQGHGDASDQSPVEQVVRLIKERMPGEISLTEAASAVHLNPSYLSQLFKQKMNRTFVDYVLQLRMDEAGKLLVHTSLRVSEIAERLGYADQAYFCHAFKRMKGANPSEYRKSIMMGEVTGV